ncbi:unannotated protein [freshwater metagenome]|uniref:Unannotated protein n=1 Tax=freshwater metagenome TaxID=449393 RepID=A0A6J6N745_9ZZZZ
MNLRAERGAAVDGLHETPLGATKGDEHLLDLLGELTGWHQHETGWTVRRGLADAHHHGNSETEGLA